MKEKEVREEGEDRRVGEGGDLRVCVRTPLCRISARSCSAQLTPSTG